MKFFKRIAALLAGTAICASLVTGLVGCGGNNDDKGNDTPDGEGVKMNDTFYNPLRVESGLGDPWMYTKDGYYYVTYSEGTQISVTRSKWMTNATANYSDETRTKVVARQKAMNLVEIWAPEIFFFDGYWYIYFTATHDFGNNSQLKNEGRRSYCLKSKTSDAMGEWESNPTMLILPENEYRSIDATFMNYNGKQYVIYAGWPTLTRPDLGEQYLYIAELETGNPTKVKESQTERVLLCVAEYDWEKAIEPQPEGPVVTYSPSGTPVLLYSASWSLSDSYCIGYMVLDGADKNPLNRSSWTKGEKPLMQTTGEIIAPGHNAVVKSPDGKEDWICYHSAKYSGAQWDRVLRLQKMTWNGDTPVVEHVYAYNEESPMPSGEKVNRVKYEAETAELGEGCTVIDSVYVDDDGKESEAASGGKAVRVTGTEGITFKVNVKTNGQYRIVVRYSNQAVSATTISVTVNGTAYSLYTPKTPYDDTFCNNAFFCDLYLRPSGPNEIKIVCDQNILIDCIVVDALEK